MHCSTYLTTQMQGSTYLPTRMHCSTYLTSQRQGSTYLQARIHCSIYLHWCNIAPTNLDRCIIVPTYLDGWIVLSSLYYPLEVYFPNFSVCRGLFRFFLFFSLENEMKTLQGDDEIRTDYEATALPMYAIISVPVSNLCISTKFLFGVEEPAS